MWAVQFCGERESKKLQQVTCVVGPVGSAANLPPGAVKGCKMHALECGGG